MPHGAAGRGSAFGMMLLILLLCVTSSLLAEDRVTFQPENAQRPLTLVGEVLDDRLGQLSLKLPNGEVQSIPLDRVTQIQTAYEPAHLRGLEELKRFETTAARRSFETALAAERRVWVGREILALLVKACQREQNLLAALMYFRQLSLSDPQTRHWAAAPLVWTPASIGLRLKEDALTWMRSDESASRLLGASVLLVDATHGAEAGRVLDQLTRDPNSRISVLSRAQLWRSELAGREINELTIDRWRDAIAHWPRELRAGPQFLLGRACHDQARLREAAAEFLWIPYVYSENEALAARALWEAGEALDRSGLPAEAESLFQELLVNYAWSSEAARVRSRPTSPGSP